MYIEKNPRGAERITLPIDMEKLKGMCEMNDFFIMTGVRKYLDNETIFDVRQMEMNPKTLSKILEFWKKNWRKCKDVKGYRKKYAISNIEFNWMNYSPVGSENVPEDVIYLYPKKKNIAMNNFEKWQECCKKGEEK